MTSHNTSAITWYKSLKDDLTEELKKTIEEWASTVETIGLRPQQKECWSQIFKETTSDVYKEILHEVHNTRDSLINEIENLMKKISNICVLLNESMPEFGQKEKNLYTEKEILTKTFEQYDKMLQERKTLIRKLQKKEEKLCHILGLECRNNILENLLPKPALGQYENYIDNLETERFKREETYFKMKDEILELTNELKYKPQDEFGPKLLSDEVHFLLTDANIKKLEEYYQTMINKKQTLKDDINGTREQIQSLALLLEEDAHKTNSFLSKYDSCTYECLDILQEELHRLQEMKKLNIERFIYKLRDEIKIWWDKCQYSKEQRAQFTFFTDDLFSEDLLSLHDIELQKLKSFYKNNSTIFMLLEKRQELWNKLLVLDSQSADRFKNRAGQLLQEEKERNLVAINIPKIEKRLLEATEEYERVHNEPFLIFGKRVSYLIDSTHKERDNEKRKRAAKRKQGTTTCTETLTKPSTSKKSQLTPSAKKMKTFNKENGTSAPPKLCFSVNKRLSIERARRIKHIRSVAKHLKSNTTNVLLNDKITYNEFEENISGDCRSTVYQPEKSPLATPLPITPNKRQLTPRSVSKSPNSKSKLAVSSLKLIF